jgi:hypothetical protein
MMASFEKTADHLASFVLILLCCFVGVLDVVQL